MPLCFPLFCSVTNKKEIGETSDNFKKQEDWAPPRSVEALFPAECAGAGGTFWRGTRLCNSDSCNLFSEQFQGLEIKKKKCSSPTRCTPQGGRRIASRIPPGRVIVRFWPAIFIIIKGLGFPGKRYVENIVKIKVLGYPKLPLSY